MSIDRSPAWQFPLQRREPVAAGHPGRDPFPALEWLQRQVEQPSEFDGVDIDAVHFKRGAVSGRLARGPST